MDYNNGNINNMQRMPGPGMPPPHMQNPNMPGPNRQNPNMQNPGMPNPGMPNPGRPYPGAPNPGMFNPNIPNPNIVNPNMPNPNMQRRMPEPAQPGRKMQVNGMQGQRMPVPGIEHGFNESRLFDKEEDEGNRRFTIPSGITAGIAGFAGYIYGGILLLCLMIALIVYGKDHHGSSGKKYSIPTDMITYTGVFRDLYESAASGALASSMAKDGTLYNDDGTEVPAAPTAIGEQTNPATDGVYSTTGTSGGSTSGATMELDNGGGTGNYSQAESYKELLTQIESAIASGDTDFIGRKFAYEDEDGNLKGYPQSVVDHFVTYMSTNSDKREALMTELGSDKYQGQNEDAFIVKLPYIKFVVNMGYDNTTISLPGFSDQVVNAGQSADIAPLLPCMYTLSISNPEWSEPVTRDIEANVNEATISINIKP